jgi:anti-sigma B factor antagonist
LNATDAIYQETVDHYFTTTVSGGRAVVSVAGELDILTAPALRAAFTDAISRAQTGVIADLSLVSFIDASGLGVLAGASGRASHLPAGLRLSGVPEHVDRLLRITGLDSSLPSGPARPVPVLVGQGAE